MSFNPLHNTDEDQLEVIVDKSTIKQEYDNCLECEIGFKLSNYI